MDNPPVVLVNGVQRHGGNLPRGTTVTFASDTDTGTIYLGVDGIDPRLPGGTLNPRAIEIRTGEPFLIDRGTTLTLRHWDGNEWSAANRAIFTQAGRRW